MQRYAMLPVSRHGLPCTDCEAPCEAACPYGLQVRSRVTGADQQLRFV